MSAIEKQRIGYSLRFRPLGKQVRVPVPVQTEEEVTKIKTTLERACRSGQFCSLSALEKDIARTSFQKSGFELPSELVIQTYEKRKAPETFWEGAESFLNYDGVAGKPALDRDMITLRHAVNILGKNKLIKDIWVPELRHYMDKRKESEKVKKNGTLNRERSTLWKFFRVMIELKVIDKNPAKFIERLSEKDGEREVYISYQDFLRIVDCASSWFPWFEPIVQTIYFTGLRRKEALNLTHKRLSLEDRLFYFGPKNTKEAAKKRVPIHKSLLEVMNRTVDLSKDHERVFLIHNSDGKGTRPPSKESLKNPWRKIMDALGLKPRPWLTDLRHTFKRNAFLSKIPERISESILGHWYAQKPIRRRYGWVSDDEFREAIDTLTLDHGPTHIFDPSIYEED